MADSGKAQEQANETTVRVIALIFHEMTSGFCFRTAFVLCTDIRGCGENDKSCMHDDDLPSIGVTFLCHSTRIHQLKVEEEEGKEIQQN